jgi:hypothetical protein
MTKICSYESACNSSRWLTVAGADIGGSRLCSGAKDIWRMANGCFD